MSEAVRSDYRFAPVPEALLFDPTITPMAVRVYAVLARHGMTPESCYPSHALIAERCGCSPRSVQRPLRELEEAGWITRVPRFDERGDRRSDGFIVRVEPALSDAPPASENAHPPASQSADPPRSGTRRKESHENESHEGTINPAPRSTDPVGKSRKKPSTPVPDLFPVTPELREWARTHAPSIDVDLETANWLDHHRAKGSRFSDWTAAWRTWMRNAQKWSRKPAAQTGPRSRITFDRSEPSGRLAL